MRREFTKGSDAICHKFVVVVGIDQFIYIYLGDCKGTSHF